MPHPRVRPLDPLMDAAEQLAVVAGPAAVSRDTAIEAVVAAADTPAEFWMRQPISGRFFLAVPRRELRRLDQTPAVTTPTATK
ncbi:hypothetical protein ACFWVM_09425 [Nocardia fluminea]|uniref:hypothetical protein n=1 Tax=Nocardia fluminea TaxID=134984 RepID=UPI00365A16AF